MVLHQCEKCGYQTHNKTDFHRHLARKRPCDQAQLPVIGASFPCVTCYRSFLSEDCLRKHHEAGCDLRPSRFGCPLCFRDLKNKSLFYYHKKKCQGPIPLGEESEEDVNHAKRIRELEAQVQKLMQNQQQPQPASSHVQNISTQNNAQNITNNTQNIVLNFDLGKGTQYDTSHITPQKVGRILHKFRPELLPQASHHLLQLIYSNPVNRNILKKSIYTKICDVFMDKEWRSLPEADVLKMLTYDVFSAILETYEQMEAAKKSDEHTEVLNLIVSDEEPYEPKACEAMRAALVDVTKKYNGVTGGTPRTSAVTG